MLGVKNIDLEYIDGRTKRTIFSNVSFDIHSGEFVSLLGPSGSGKSSLLYIVSLLKTPTAGEIYLDDVMISGAKNKNEIRYENFFGITGKYDHCLRNTRLRHFAADGKNIKN